jgi:hypothetical protein
VTATIFTDPFSGHETLLIEPPKGPRVGASYDPRRTELPIAWHIDCHHCTQLRWKSNLTIEQKREILIVRGRVAGHVPTHQAISHAYHVPTMGHPHLVRAWQKDGSSKHATIRGSDLSEILHAVQKGNGPIEYDGNLQKFRALETSLKRYLKFILSARVVEREELEAVLRPLVQAQRSRKPFHGHHKICDMIDWISVLSVELANE